MKFAFLTIFCVISISLFAESEIFDSSDIAQESIINITRYAEWRGDEIQQVLLMQDKIKELNIKGLSGSAKSLVLGDQLLSGTFPELLILKLLDCDNLHIEIPRGFAPNLETFELIRHSHQDHGNPSISGIDHFPKLKRLVLVRVGDEEIRSLDHVTFPYLEELDLSLGFFHFFRYSIPISTLAPNLKSLSLSGARLHFGFHEKNDEFYRSVWGLHQLESLDLSGLQFLDLPDFSLLPATLKELSLSGSGVREIDFDNFSHLEILNFQNSFLAFDLREFSHLESIKSLNLSRNQFSPENIEQLQYVMLPTLEELVLDQSNIRGVKLSTFAPNLKRLSLNESNITGGDIPEIVQLENLESLKIGCKSLTGAILKKLGGLQALRELSLASTNMSKADFSVLPLSLESLDLSGSTLSIASFNTLYEMKQLKELYIGRLQNGNIKPEMIDALQEALPNCKIY